MPLDREVLLLKAVNDVRKWCAPAESMVGRKHPDTFWMELFDYANETPITADHAHKFLTSFQLTITVEWDKVAVAEILASLRKTVLTNPTNDVPLIAARLRECNKPKSRQTSAASKIVNFAKPGMAIFIWDQLASRSARRRDWLRSGSGGRGRSGLYLRAGEHDYLSFYEACSKALADEQLKPDFEAAVSGLDADMLSQGGLFSDRSRVSRPFIERRLLDKLMFWEGWSLKYQKPLPR